MRTPTEDSGRERRRPARISERRVRSLIAVFAAALAVLVADVASKVWAESALTDTTVSVGPLTLRLGHNPGVAFGLGAGLPAGVVPVLTGGLVLVLGLWAVFGSAPPPAAGLIFGGGLANLVDRAGDGVVTDFLDLGWWPSFNVADSAITVGALLLLLLSARNSSRSPVTGRAPSADR